MGMSNGRGQSIGFVLFKILTFVEENLNHVNHLILGRPSYPPPLPVSLEAEDIHGWASRFPPFSEGSLPEHGRESMQIGRYEQKKSVRWRRSQDGYSQSVLQAHWKSVTVYPQVSIYQASVCNRCPDNGSNFRDALPVHNR